MKYILILFAFLLTSCVSIPIPPTGSNQGKLGSIRLVVSYVPYANPNTEMNSNTKYAWEHFSKTLKDK